MANRFTTGRVFTIGAADACYLENTSDGFVGTMAVMLVSNSFSGSITVKSRIMGKDASDATVVPVAVNYLGRYVNGAIGTDTLGSAAITGTSLILIPASGQVPVLDCTSWVSGSMTVYCFPLDGAAA